MLAETRGCPRPRATGHPLGGRPLNEERRGGTSAPGTGAATGKATGDRYLTQPDTVCFNGGMTETHATDTTTEQAVFQAAWDTPMNSRGWLSIDDAGWVNQRGLATGLTTAIKIQDTPLGRVLTVHEAGSTHWTGRGIDRQYNPAQIHTFLIDPVVDDTGGRRYVHLTSVGAKTNQAERQSLAAVVAARLS